MHMNVVNETKLRRITNMSHSKVRIKDLKTTTKMLVVSFYLIIDGKNGWRISRLMFTVNKCLVLNVDSQERSEVERPSLIAIPKKRLENFRQLQVQCRPTVLL